MGYFVVSKYISSYHIDLDFYDVSVGIVVLVVRSDLQDHCVDLAVLVVQSHCFHCCFPHH